MEVGGKPSNPKKQKRLAGKQDLSTEEKIQTLKNTTPKQKVGEPKRGTRRNDSSCEEESNCNGPPD
jgi:hypothetical protein